MRAVFACVVALAAALTGCGDSEDGRDDSSAQSSSSGAGGGSPACAPGELSLPDGGCLAAGTQTNGCPAGQVDDGGSCRPAGVPPDGCASGFVHDGSGCTAVLPEQPCEAGLMALPGDRACRPIQTCGQGTWGDIPVDTSTQHVDASYLGGDSDGSVAKPWPTIQQGIDNAAPGAIVAVAAGTYLENVRFYGKDLKLWGVCPDDVEIAGPHSVYAALEIDPGVQSAEVHGLAVRGESVGVLVAAADCLLDRVWVHSTGHVGIVVQDSAGDTQARIVDSLVEGVPQAGIYVGGGAVEIERTEVRNVTPGVPLPGIGVGATPHVQTDAASSVKLHSSRVHHVTSFGVAIADGPLVLEATSISDVQSDEAGAFGGGVQVEGHQGGRVPAELNAASSVIERVRFGAIVVAGAAADARTLTLRDIDPATEGGRGLSVQLGDLPTSFTLRDSTIERASEAGIFAGGASVGVEGVVVRDTRPNKDGVAGQGIAARDVSGGASNLQVTSCELAGNRDAAIVVIGSEAVLDGVWVHDTLPSPSSMFFGRGVTAQLGVNNAQPAKVSLRSSLIESSYEAGVYVGGSEMTMEATVVRGTMVSAGDGGAGDAVAVVWAPSGGSALVRGSVLSDSARAGISGFGATVGIEGNLFDCNAIDLDGEEEVGQEPSFQLTGNRCGCGTEEVACQIRTQKIAPPAAP